jgi:pilus assembly protein Flp/PilA
MSRPRHASRDERAASAVEYGLLIAGVAAVIAAAVFIFGGAVSGLFTDTCTAVQAADHGSCTP